jgi:hypothetical protein
MRTLDRNFVAPRHSSRLAARAFLTAVVLTTAAIAGPASAQTKLTLVDGRFECGNQLGLFGCADHWETEFNKAHPGIVSRDKDNVLVIKLLSGQTIGPPLSDCRACFQPLELLLHGRFLALWTGQNEDVQWYLVDRKTGLTLQVEGYPLLSPDGRMFVAAEADEMNSHFLDIYSVNASGVTLMFRADPVEWFPRHVRWLDNSTVAYARATYNDAIERLEVLKLENGKWKAESR